MNTLEYFIIEAEEEWLGFFEDGDVDELWRITPEKAFELKISGKEFASQQYEKIPVTWFTKMD